MTLSPSFKRDAFEECYTKRSTLTTGFDTNLDGLFCFPLAPIDPETRLRLQLNTPHSLWETWMDESDIIQGDRLVIRKTTGDIEYTIKTVESHYWKPSKTYRLHLTLEDTRQ